MFEIKTHLYNFVLYEADGDPVGNVWAVMAADKKEAIVARFGHVTDTQYICVDEVSEVDAFDTHGYANYEHVCQWLDLQP